MAENRRYVRPRKVMRVIARLNIGGPAIQAAMLTSGLDQNEFDSTLVTGTETRREGNMLELDSGKDYAAGVTPVVIPELGRTPSPFRDLIAFARLASLMREVKPAIVHTHTAKAGTLGRIAARLTGVPVVVHTFHGNVFTGYFNPLTSWLLARWERLMGLLSTAVIAISEGQKRDLIRVGIPDHKIRVIPLGLPLDRFTHVPSKATARRELDLDPECIAIGFIARLVPVKNPLLMVEAVSKYRRSNPSAVLVVAGDGPLREELEAAAARLDVPLRLLGWRGDLDHIYPALDVVALSSRNEGLPVALIEAMAAGVPVASTRVGGVPDLLEDGTLGALARQDAASLSAAFERATAMSATDRSNAAKIVSGRYGAQRLISDISRLYDELIGSS